MIVNEVKRQKLDAGFNFSTGDGLGVRLGYEHYNISFKRGYTGSRWFTTEKSRASSWTSAWAFRVPPALLAYQPASQL